jgi:hypothetical protein
MGNYKDLEADFIERTLELISQYEIKMHEFAFEKQFNHTLLVNCLLGLIVFPKEKSFSLLPIDRLSQTLKKEMGISNSTFNGDDTNLKSLIVSLRHSIAHFDVTFESQNDDFLIDRIVFRDKDKGLNYIVASFAPSELLSFIRYYGFWLTSNIRKNKF